MVRLLIVGMAMALVGLLAPSAHADSRFDGRLREVIQDRFLNDSRVLSKDINVETRNQEVVLRGVVGSPTERAAAINIVTATPGVTKITNELTVEPTSRTDSLILREALEVAPTLGRINGSTVVIGVSDQVITVQGVFPTLAALDRVVSGLMVIEGVKDVKVEATVEPPENVSDKHLLAAVAQSLMTDGTVDASRLKVGVRNGLVVLEGQVPSLFQLVQAEEITRNLTGVKSVQNHLRLPEGGQSAKPVG